MSDIWDAYVFWMNIYGPQIIIGMTFSFGYWTTKRLAVARHQRWLSKYQVNE